MEQEGLLLIGEFSVRSRLSAKALRLYDEAGLLVPVRVDTVTGYGWYAPEQLERARLIEGMRHLQMPLARIRQVLDLPADDAAWVVRVYARERREQVLREQPVVEWLCSRLDGSPAVIDPDAPQTITEAGYDMVVRTLPDRAVISTDRYVSADSASSELGTLLAQLEPAGQASTEGAAGSPFVILHWDADQDGGIRIELVRPMADLRRARQAAAVLTDVHAAVEPGHDEATITVTAAELDWASPVPVLDALVRRSRSLGRVPSGPPRMIMTMDWRTATPRDPACDFALPLHPRSAHGSDSDETMVIGTAAARKTG